MLLLVNLFILLIGPFYLVGLINRTKSIWAGRKGFPIFQLLFDVIRLAKKKPLYSRSTSWIFQSSATILLATTLVGALIVPVIPGVSFSSFSYDFLFVTYLFALGRLAMVLAALDAASSFEGMGASREISFAVLAEPIFILCLGTIQWISESPALRLASLSGSELVLQGPSVWLICFALFIFLLNETSRLPIDDPNTHLELTMIHEVMILDHSGLDLAAIQFASALKLTLLTGLISTFLNPFSTLHNPVAAVLTSVLLMSGLAVGIGLIESVTARIRMKFVPQFLAAALFTSLLALALSQVKGWWVL